jgi:hypothetical protein
MFIANFNNISINRGYQFLLVGETGESRIKTPTCYKSLTTTKVASRTPRYERESNSQLWW